MPYGQSFFNDFGMVGRGGINNGVIACLKNRIFKVRIKFVIIYVLREQGSQ